MPPQFNEPFNNQILDTNATPRFLMIPHRSQMTMLLHYSNGEMVRSNDKATASIEEVDRNTWSRFLTRPTGGPTPNHLNPWSLPARRFNITGEKPGTAYIEVGFVQRLEVSVKTQKTHEISFHFVEDISGNKTTRDPNIVNDLIRSLDDIYSPRTNVSFLLRRAAPTQANVYLPDFFRERMDAEDGITRSQSEWNKLVDKSDNGALFNVFFVPTVKPKKSSILFPMAHTIGTNLVCDDDRLSDTIINVLSHDIAVALGCNTTSDPKRRHHLMFESPIDRINLRRTGDFIPKDCVHLINP